MKYSNINSYLHFLYRIIVFVSFLLLAKVLLLDFYPDFSIYYEASKSFTHGMNPYLGGKQFFTAFVYPPFVLVFFLPFVTLPFFIAEKVWISLSLILLLASVGIMYRMNNIKLLSSEAMIISSLVFIFFPAKFTLGMGQSNMVILFLVTLFLYFFQKNKQIPAAIALGFSIAIKLFPVLFLAYLFLQKQWKIFFITSGTVIGLFGIAYLINPEINRYFYQHILPTLFSSEKTDYYNQALSGFLLRGFHDKTIITILKIGISSFILISTFVVIVKKLPFHRTPSNSPLSGGGQTNFIFSLLITVSVLINSFSWQHHFVWLLIPFLITYSSLRTGPQTGEAISHYVMLLISFMLVAGNLKNPSHVPILLQSHVFYGGLLLWILQIRLLSFAKTSSDMVEYICVRLQVVKERANNVLEL